MGAPSASQKQETIRSNKQVTELQEQLLELQTEYDYFKQQKQEQIDELKDVVDRFNKLEEEIEQYRNLDRNQDDILEQLKIKTNQIDSQAIEIEALNDQLLQAINSNSQKEQEIGELEN